MQLLKIINLIPISEKKHVIPLLVISFFLCMFEVFGIASIMPFVAVITDPNLIEKNEYLNMAYQYLQFPSKNKFIIFLGMVFLTFIVISNLMRIFTTFLTYKFSLFCEKSLGVNLTKLYLEQSYEWFIKIHSANLAKNILSDVNYYINTSLIPLINLAIYGSLILILLFCALIINPIITTLIFSIVCFFYLIIYFFFKHILSLAGKSRFISNNKRFLNLNNAFKMFLENKIFFLDNFFKNKMSSAATDYAKANLKHKLIAEIPRYILEILLFIIILFITLIFFFKYGDIDRVIPILSFYALFSYKLLPAIQRVYGSYSTIISGNETLNQLYNSYQSLDISRDRSNKINILPFNYHICLKNVSFEYSGRNTMSLNNFNLEIHKGTSLGVVGETGSGKSTFSNIVMGLLEPKYGKLLVDGVEINSHNVNNWRKNISFVSQSINLLDDTIENNITLNFDNYKKTNIELLEKSTIFADIHDFIINLPFGYQTKVGENGISLSGGQIQRIAIARAMYRKPELIIFDEATNALDILTELKIRKNIDESSIGLTKIIISHNYSSIRNCDQIIFISNGKIIEKGTFNELTYRNLEFKKIVTKQNINYMND